MFRVEKILSVHLGRELKCVLFVGNFKIITVNNTKVPILMVTCIMFDVFNNVKFPRKWH